MDPKNTPCVPPMRAGLLPETGRITSVTDGLPVQLGLVEPFFPVVGRDGLLRGGNQVLIPLVTPADVVELLVELLKLKTELNGGKGKKKMEEKKEKGRERGTHPSTEEKVLGTWEI